MQKLLVFAGWMLGGGVLLLGGLLLWADGHLRPAKTVYYPAPKAQQWAFQSVDTMKYSRDLAREKLDDETFDAVIDKHTERIAATGATHIAIATPYDEEFFPILRRWVDFARKHKLSVWFRGNWSGWEGWFGYARIGQEEHQKKTEAFILKHPELFEDGDVFSSCPECENGGPGDPRKTGDVRGYRQFLIAEHTMMQKAFQNIGKTVRTNFFSMNGDVARLVMDEDTTRALGGIVTIDHYVKTPERLVQDIEALAKKSGGKVVLGEFGVPIPDIHGSLQEREQAQWVDRALGLLSQNEHIEGVSYWLSVGGSTEIWTDTDRPRETVGVLTRHFKPVVVYGFVRDELGRPVTGASVTYAGTQTATDDNGYFALRVAAIDSEPVLHIEAVGYESESPAFVGDNREMGVTLKKSEKDLLFRWLLRVKEWRDG